MANFAAFYPILLANEGGYNTDPQDLGGETFAGIARKFWPQWQGWALLDRIKAAHPFEYGKDWKQNAAFSRKYLFTCAELMPLVRAFYDVNFWRPMQLEYVDNQSIANQIADHGINAGTTRAEGLAQWVLKESFGGVEFKTAAGKSLGRCADLVVDCQLGARSVAALNQVPAEKFFARFRDVREEFYRYRADAVKDEVARAPQLLKLHTFFRATLKYNRSSSIPAAHLKSWLNRIDHIKFHV